MEENNNSTSGRGARASYQTISPEISARGSLFGRAEFLIPVVTGRLGREGEKCRPLDHVWQIPFIHSTLFEIMTYFFIYITVFRLFVPCGAAQCLFDSLRMRYTQLKVRGYYYSLVCQNVCAATWNFFLPWRIYRYFSYSILSRTTGRKVNIRRVSCYCLR